VACHDLASLRATGERNPRLLAAGPPGWLRVQGREGALSAPGEGAGLGAGSGAADVAVCVGLLSPGPSPPEEERGIDFFGCGLPGVALVPR